MILWAHVVSKERSSRELLWAFLASGAALMSIFMTAPLMVHRQYWLIVALGISLAWQPSGGVLPAWLTDDGVDLARTGAPVDNVTSVTRLARPRPGVGTVNGLCSCLPILLLDILRGQPVPSTCPRVLG